MEQAFSLLSRVESTIPKNLQVRTANWRQVGVKSGGQKCFDPSGKLCDSDCLWAFVFAHCFSLVVLSLESRFVPGTKLEDKQSL